MALDDESQLRQQLAQLELQTRTQALLALAAWQRTGIVAERLFHSVAALQRPAWGSWNGLLSSLAKARRNVLQTGTPEQREALRAETLLGSLLDAHETVPEGLEKANLEALANLLGSQVPRRLRRDQLLGLAISLRNRVAHDQPTDPVWWQQGAAALRPLSEALDAPLPPEAPAPWFLQADGKRWSFNGLRKDLVGIFVDAGGNSRFEDEQGEAVVAAFQSLLGQEAVQAEDLKRLLGKLAPEDLKGVLMDDYLVGPLAGEGGFASVHVGRQLSTGRKVAIKFLKPGLPEEAKQRFLQEATFLSRFHHPHIVEVLGRGESIWRAPRSYSLDDEDWYGAFKAAGKQRTWMALEWVDGGTLERCPEGASEDQILQWFAQAADALQAVHEQGVIHRDVKPANLMVSEQGQLKLMDFGIARSQELQRTLMTVEGVVGTPAYMAPEQLRATAAEAEVGPQADVYALCATFYELLTSTRLFDHDTAPVETITLKKIQGVRPPRARRLQDELSWEIETVLMGGLEPEASDRYRSAEALRRDVERIRASHPIQYRKTSIPRRAILAYRRNRALMNVVVLSLAIFSAGVAQYVVDLRLEEQNTRKANERANIALRKSRENLAVSSAARIAKDDRLAATLLLKEVPAKSTIPNWSNLTFQVLQGPALPARLPHGTLVRSARWSNDYKEIWTFGTDGSEKRWSHPRGSLQGSVISHNQAIGAAHYDQSGRYLAISSKDGSVSIRDEETKTAIIRLNSSASERPLMAWHPTKPILAIRGKGSRLVLLSPRPRKKHSVDTEEGRIIWLQWSQNGKTLTVLTDNDVLQNWTHTLEPIASIPNKGDGRRVGLFENPNQDILIAKLSDGRLCLLAAATSLETTCIRPGYQIRTAALNSTARLLATVPMTGFSVDIWDAQTGQHNKRLKGHTGYIYKAVWNPRGDALATVSEDQTARVWSLNSPAPSILLHGHTGIVQDAAWHKDGIHLLTASLDGTARVWDTQTSRKQSVHQIHGGSTIRSVGRAPGGGRILTSGADGFIKIWREADFDQELRSTRAHKRWIRTARWSPNGKRILSASDDQTVRLWNSETLELIGEFVGHQGTVTAAEFHPNEEIIASVSVDRFLHVWDVKPPHKVVMSFEHSSRLDDVAWHPKGNVLALAGDDGDIVLVPRDSGKPVTVLEGHQDEVNSVVWNQDGSLLLSSSRDRSVMIWQPFSKKLPTRFSGHSSSVRRAIFSPDEKYIASVSSDHSLRIWMATSTQAILSMTGHEHTVYDLDWRSSQEPLLTVSRDGTLRRWNMPQEGPTSEALEKWLHRLTHSCLTAYERQQYLAELADEAQANERRCRQDKGTLPLSPAADPTSP